MSEVNNTVNIQIPTKDIQRYVDEAVKRLKEEIIAQEMEPKFCDFCNHTILDMKDSIQLTDRRDGSVKNFHSKCFMTAIKRTAFGCFDVLAYENEPEILIRNEE